MDNKKINIGEIRERASNYKNMAERITSDEEIKKLDETFKRENEIMAMRYQKLADWLFNYAEILERQQAAADGLL